MKNIEKRIWSTHIEANLHGTWIEVRAYNVNTKNITIEFPNGMEITCPMPYKCSEKFNGFTENCNSKSHKFSVDFKSNGIQFKMSGDCNHTHVQLHKQHSDKEKLEQLEWKLKCSERLNSQPRAHYHLSGLGVDNKIPFVMDNTSITITDFFGTPVTFYTEDADIGLPRGVEHFINCNSKNFTDIGLRFADTDVTEAPDTIDCTIRLLRMQSIPATLTKIKGVAKDVTNEI